MDPTPLVRTCSLLFIASCAAQGSATVAPQPPTDPGDGDRYDPCDVCVLDGLDDTPGEDNACGCADPDFFLTDACSLSSDEEARASRAATLLLANTHLTSVRLVSGRAACANVVRMALERHGVPSSRLVVATRGAEPSVILEPAAWDGKRCPGTFPDVAGGRPQM
jgi:hypothetical protein